MAYIPTTASTIRFHLLKPAVLEVHYAFCMSAALRFLFSSLEKLSAIQNAEFKDGSNMEVGNITYG